MNDPGKKKEPWDKDHGPEEEKKSTFSVENYSDHEDDTDDEEDDECDQLADDDDFLKDNDFDEDAAAKD
jgi:hypothetical protein